MADGAAEAGAAASAAADAMGGIEAPLAQELAAPRSEVAGQLASSLPPFHEYAAELLEFQKVTKQMQETSGAGRRLMFQAAAQLQRADFAGAKASFLKAEALPTLRAAISGEQWADPEQRLGLFEAGNVGWFVQGSLGCRGLREMLESGVLTPSMPEHLRTGIDDVDDEKYLLGSIDAARELERYAVNRGQELDLHSIQVCLGAVQCLEQALMQFNFRNSDLRRKFDGVKYIVKKLETVAYEVDLAKKRGRASASAATAAATAADDSSKQELPGGAAEQPSAAKMRKLDPATGQGTHQLAIDMALLRQIKERYDQFDLLREQTIKRSRDVTKNAKNAIFAMQREDLRKADGLLKQCAKDANSIYSDLAAKTPSLRGGSFSAALEELAEALSYRAFRKDSAIQSRAAMQETSGLSFKLTLPEYIGGLMDLTGEVGRLAVRSAGRGHQATAEVGLCLACVDSIYAGLQDLPFLPGGLGKKMGPLKGTLTKTEGILYELALLSKGGITVRAPAPTAAEEHGESDAREPQV